MKDQAKYLGKRAWFVDTDKLFNGEHGVDIAKTAFSALSKDMTKDFKSRGIDEVIRDLAGEIPEDTTMFEIYDERRIEDEDVEMFDASNDEEEDKVQHAGKREDPPSQAVIPADIAKLASDLS